MNTPIELDKWDLDIISICKSSVANPRSVSKALGALWAERCALELKYVRQHDIVQRLMRIVEVVKPRGTSGLIDNLIWTADTVGGEMCSTTLMNMTQAYCVSSLMITKVSDIPGYKEYLDELSRDENSAT